ncbi:hypothetical protein SEPCBS57363_002279 [Sporothrix epigloea]|uniref:Protein kinase domain-containing protein n=1 Tax=Sporothrix epigloea TaxID=1892477 RepID=A0ABP0DEZ8_9PEZI
MVWYDADHIECTVTRQFVCSHLLPEEIARLDHPLAFGDGLTDGTYWEWIKEKAKKIFLILVDLHVPDQIFGVIDDSWNDEDLPIAQEHVERLALTASHNARFDRKFYRRQYYYLLRPLTRSDQVVVYEDMEIVPLDLVDSTGSAGTDGSSSAGLTGGLGGSTSVSGLAGGISSSSSSGHAGGGDRVALPSYPGMVFSRRRIPLAPIAGSSYGAGQVTLEEFEFELSSIQSLQNEHLVSYFAAYVHQGYGYVLFTPAADGSIKSLLATTPATVKALTLRDRNQLIFNWIHCLVDTLCFVHSRGLSHGNIKPSTVLFNRHHKENHVFFSDFTRFGLDSMEGFGHDRTSFDKESYDYAAPEQWYRPLGSSGGGGSSNGSKSSRGSRRSTLTGEGGSGGRGAGIKMYASSIISSSSSSNSGRDHTARSRRRHNSGGENTALGHSVSPSEHTKTLSGFMFQVGASPHFRISRSSTMGSTFGSGGDSYYSSAAASVGSGMPVPQLNPQAADIFSLGCVILELIGFMLKRQTRSFAAHRAAKHKSPGRGGAVLDSSFHKNLGQVESWMAGLAHDAASLLDKKRSTKCPADDDRDDETMAGVAPTLHVVERMLALHASERPSAYDVQVRMYQVLRDHCKMAEPHCVHEYGGLNTGWLDHGGGSSGSYPHSPSATSAMSPTSTTSDFSCSSYGDPASPTTMPFRSSSLPLGYQHIRHAVNGRCSAVNHHARQSNGSGESVRSSVAILAGGAIVIPEESESGSTTADGGGFDLANGLQAIRNLQIREKVRQSWKSAVYAA